MNDEQKIEYLEQYADEVDKVPESEREAFKQMVEEGCIKEWPVALHIKAYSCYGGNSLWECDWKTSRDCLLKLVSKAENPFHFNTLGYIYYYGRCNNGIPEYDKAFQYFSVGAAHGVYESMYKIADMFSKGNGCIKSPIAASKIVASLYRENRDIFIDGDFDGKFADVALRMGGLYERGEGVEQDMDEAYAFYLEAKLAIEKRLKDYNYYGDRKVQKNINDAIARVVPQLPENYFKKFIEMPEPFPVGAIMSNSIGLDISVDEYKGYYRIKAKGFAGEDANGYALLSFPNIQYCELANEVTLYLEQSSELSENVADDLPFTAFITGIVYDEDEDCWRFMYRDMEMLAIKCEKFYFYK